MSTKQSRRPKSPPSGFSALPVEEILSPWLTGMAVAGDAIEPFYKSLLRTNLEAMSFLCRRTLASLDAPARMAVCRTPQELMAEQLRFWTDAARDTQETNARIMQVLGSASSAPVKGGRKTAGAKGPQPLKPSEAEKIIRDILNLTEQAAPRARTGQKPVAAE